MYLYYEHHRDAAGKVILSEMRFSSYANGMLAINRKNAVEKMLFDLCVPIMKWPPVTCRAMDDKNWVWSYFGQYGISSTYGEEVITKLLRVTEGVGFKIGLVLVEDLAAQAMNHKVDLSAKPKPKMSAEEFFYNHAAPAAQPEMTKESISSQLAELMGVSIAAIDKKTYRQAALRYHPDRNNGDGSKMSTLNMLWRVWNG